MIGYGAIGMRLAGLITEGEAGPATLVVVLVRDPGRHSAGSPAAWPFVDRVEELLASHPDVVVEAAGHEAVRAHVPGVLRSGVDVLSISIGALADPELLTEIRASAVSGHSRFLLAAGAVGSLDALAAARTLGLTSVTHTIRKPLSSLPDLALRDGDAEEVVAFSGTARAAALSFPANANVVAAVGLAGIGLDRTAVRIIGSAGATRNVHEIEAEGTFGEMTFRISNRPVAGNPRSSVLAAGSLAAALAGLVAPIRWA